MKHTRLLLGLGSGAVILAAAGAATFSFASGSAHPSVDNDPRTASPLVKVTETVHAGLSQRGFTGTIAARVQSNLGFRVPGKIIERLVDTGQQVKAGQPLMRIDENDLHLAMVAKQNAVAAARAALIQVSADEKRYASLVATGYTPRQRYEIAKAALDTTTAQLAAAEAEARVAENEATYSVLKADADGTVMETLGEPGQVVAAGQTVVRLAHAGPREAIVALPETMHPAIGTTAEASIYGTGQRRWSARLRQLSDTADPQTRTYEARYVLEGDAALAPLGATVTIRVANDGNAPGVEVPVGAVFDDGNKIGVWVVDQASSTVRFKPITIHRLGEETAVVSGLQAGESIVSLGAHLLHDGDSIRTSVEKEGY
ncbi:efflux RND transporter periplasmic adaptor subunit [Beijerinckia indica]|uniref:Efflux transporter, RND family, MFP subunit n=1 Tax=Beijerinckia indica subsp. indica (strain ATCC 9039 / DSM 1715 / NCIMB 8712) TaxID=395963 RepID=B2IIV2_BEII9|nr:efflux RND transporter periplasmic adaptor subunit [Beijerinckia indica]ACB96164.1 efflux transporter, RND family, MFP subunit [Beijerinckia indica subsp. indica ATCC 9039]